MEDSFLPVRTRGTTRRSRNSLPSRVFVRSTNVPSRKKLVWATSGRDRSLLVNRRDSTFSGRVPGSRSLIKSVSACHKSVTQALLSSIIATTSAIESTSEASSYSFSVAILLIQALT